MACANPKFRNAICHQEILASVMQCLLQWHRSSITIDQRTSFWQMPFMYRSSDSDAVSSSIGPKSAIRLSSFHVLTATWTMDQEMSTLCQLSTSDGTSLVLHEYKSSSMVASSARVYYTYSHRSISAYKNVQIHIIYTVSKLVNRSCIKVSV